jgi:acetyl-CoA carboxylase biotin carboxylase subunit
VPDLFRKILVANRGEIAIRVMRTCRELGIGTVAVYSDVDRTALHVRYADEAYHIGPSPALESYLNMGRILDAARAAGADAIHPGYGFLSENPEFAEACTQAGLVFIGPTPNTIELLGDKLQARQLARQHGIPVVPGTDAEVGVEEALKAADQVGYPVMIKAAAGGGGRGIRMVSSRAEMVDALQNARWEAQVAFGDATVYVEKYLAPVRHIEVQIVGDNHGHVNALWERECSIQRRHQKLIEECPSPAVDDGLRALIRDTAERVARAAGYSNVGTVEFLLDSSGQFYFLEMNTRLQVEHPVTELVSGEDFVLQQIRVAAGEPVLPVESLPPPRGWAIECRISAEDPEHNFVPSIGTVSHVELPAGPGVRVESALYQGFAVSEFYDPLLAKICSWGRDRGEAIARMRRALSEFSVAGIKTNAAFHRAMMQDPRFVAGELNTSLLDAGLPVLDAGEDAQHAALVAAVLWEQQQGGASRLQGAVRGGRVPQWRGNHRRAAVAAGAMGGAGWRPPTG